MKLYHNPRCSKSRAVKALLDDCEEDYQIIEYQKHPFSRAELTAILDKLKMKPKQLIRQGDAKKAGHDLNAMSDDKILLAMVHNPSLIERPIVLKDNKAALGRPPEDVLKIL